MGKFITIFILAMFGMAAIGCSHSMLMKKCSTVTGDEEWFKCKKPKPWE